MYLLYHRFCKCKHLFLTKYEIYCFLIPQSKNTYSPFIKSTTKSLVLPELTKYISEHFECSKTEAEEYIQMTDKDFVEDILVKQGIDEKEIKKLLKEIQ